VETDEKSSFPAGTVFIVPAFTTLSINWSDPVEIIIMQPDQQLFQDSFSQSSLFKENNSTKNVTSFSCKDCKPLSHLIWDEICQRGGQDEAYLNVLGLVLMRTIARVLLNERASTDIKIGLSNQRVIRYKRISTKTFTSLFRFRIWLRCWEFPQAIFRRAFERVLDRRLTNT